MACDHEVVLLATDRRVLVEHVVEVADVGDRDATVASTAASTRLARTSVNGSRRSSVLATGSSIASAGTSASDGCSAADSSMQSASECHGEVEPLLDREVGIGVALARAA